MVSSAIHALTENNRIGIYQRAHGLCRVIYDNTRNSPGIKKEDLSKYRVMDAPCIVPVDIPYLREAVDRSARFVKVGYSTNKETGRQTEYTKKVLPPVWILEGIQARGVWPFPRMEGVTEAPTLRPDGTILQTPGFDEQTGLLYSPGRFAFEKANEKQTFAESISALQRLEDVFVDFPFKTKNDLVAAMAAALSVLVRPAIAGQVPLFAVRATVRGSGKTLLVNAIECLRSGRTNAQIDPYTGDPEEFRKQILGFALDGTGMIMIDNVTGSFGSPVLDSVLTSGQVRGRLLYDNKPTSLPMRAVWFVTGNNLAFRGDLADRTIPIDLEIEHERPRDMARDFAHGQGIALLSWLQKERESLVPALVAAVAEYLRSGQAALRSDARIGSFESWDEIVVGTLLRMKYPDPRLGRKELAADDDMEFASLVYLLKYLRENDISPFTAADLLYKSHQNDVLKELLIAFAPPRKAAEYPTTMELGYALRSAKDRIAGGLRLKSTRTERGAVYAVK